MQEYQQQAKDEYASYYPITVKRHPAYGYGYGLALTRSLLIYAEHDAYFEKILLLLLQQLGFPTNKQKYAPEALRAKRYDELFMLSDQKDALQRMEWVIERTRARDLPDALIAERTLSSWVSERTKESPKAIVIGIVVGVVPPVGLGHLNRKKKMSLIVERAVSRDAGLLATCAAEASLGLLLDALVRAKGDTKKFEPEIADWFFGERAVELYVTNEPVLDNIKKELAELSAIYYPIEDGGHMTAIAISPVTNSLLQEIHWDIEPLL